MGKRILNAIAHCLSDRTLCVSFQEENFKLVNRICTTTTKEIQNENEEKKNRRATTTTRNNIEIALQVKKRQATNSYEKQIVSNQQWQERVKGTNKKDKECCKHIV